MAWTYATTFPPFIKLATIITILRLLVFIINQNIWQDFPSDCYLIICSFAIICLTVDVQETLSAALRNHLWMLQLLKTASNDP